MEDMKLVKVLRSMKRYFFLECGELFGFFLDSCENEL